MNLWDKFFIHISRGLSLFSRHSYLAWPRHPLCSLCERAVHQVVLPIRQLEVQVSVPPASKPSVSVLYFIILCSSFISLFIHSCVHTYSKVHWTVVYRRVHKKGSIEESRKRRGKKTTKARRDITGLTLAAIKQRRTLSARKEIRADAEKKLKEEREKRKAAAKAALASKKASASRAAPAPKAPKNISRVNKGGAASTGR